MSAFGVVFGGGVSTPIIGRLNSSADELPSRLDFELLTGNADKTIVLSLFDVNGVAANLANLVLSVVIESHDRSDVEIVDDASIQRSAGVIAFDVPAAMLIIARTLRWSLRANGGGILAGRIVVRYAAAVDPAP